MAPVIFSKAIMEGTPIDVFNYGDMKRDFTYIDDIVEGVVRVSEKTPTADPKSTQQILIQIAATCLTCFTILEFIETMENALGKRAIKNMKPMQAGDVQQTHAATDALHALVGFTPTTILVEGITQFAKRYVPYQSISKSVSAHA